MKSGKMRFPQVNLQHSGKEKKIQNYHWRILNPIIEKIISFILIHWRCQLQTVNNAPCKVDNWLDVLGLPSGHRPLLQYPHGQP